MAHYRSNIRDLDFNLFEFFNISSVLDSGESNSLDSGTVRAMLSEVRRLAEGPLAESFSDADRNPPIFDPETHSVILPESFKRSFRALSEGDWARLALPEELGGASAPHVIFWAISELILGSQPAAFMYGMTGSHFSTVFYNNGTDEQKKWAQIIADRNWGATMVLTEPDAGSDVGAGRTKAVQQEDGSWHIEGV
uniref:acyl-CoA dehydrogenase family protein n=1 Tax=Nocardia acidivorans TaxID=404580 RepID=UPI0014720711